MTTTLQTKTSVPTPAESADALAQLRAIDPDLGRLAEITRFLHNGGTLAEVIGLDARELEAMYAVGHGLYEQGRYDEAHKMFSLLCMHAPNDGRFPQAAAGAARMLGRYEDALGFYCVACMRSPGDHQLAFQTVECLLALNQPGPASDMLDALVSAPDLPATGRARAEALLEALRSRSQPTSKE